MPNRLVSVDSATHLFPSAVRNANNPDATTSTKGKVELATTAEATTGTDTTRAVTPAGLKAGIGSAITARSSDLMALRGFRAALLAPTVDIDILQLGHSITEGARATAPGNRWADKCVSTLRAAVRVGGGFGYWPATNTYGALVLPSVWAYTGTTTVGPSGDGLGRYYRAMSAGSTATLTFTGTSIDVRYTSYSGGPVVPVTIDGGAVASINANSGGASNYAASTTYSGLSAGSHTIVLSPGSALNLQGATVYNGDETAGFRTWNAGHSGDQLSNWLSAAALARGKPIYTSINPQLVTIEFMVNEYRNNTSSATYATNLGTFIDEVRSACGEGVSIIVMSDAEPLHGGTPAEPWGAYKTATATICTTKGVALFDMSLLPGLGLNGSGMDVDQVHPNNTGHATIGSALAQFLMSL